MQDDLDSKAVSLTHFIFKIPSYKKIILYILLLSFFAGFALQAFLQIDGKKDFTESFYYGGSNGVILFGLPAVIAAILATSILSLSSFRQAFKYFLFIAFISMVLTIVIFLGGYELTKNFSMPGSMAEIFLLSASLVMVVWYVGLRVPLNYTWTKSLSVALLHPLFQLSLVLIWRAYTIIEIKSPVMFALQFLVSSSILLLALWSLLFLVNAPAKRNFGISTVQASALFFAQWVKGGKGLEEILAEVGSLVETEVGVVGFRTKDGLKASFIVPLVHFGPVGNLGGSEYPPLLRDYISKKSGGEVFVFHGTVTHDFNPVFSSSYQHIGEKAVQLLDDQSGYSPRASFWQSHEGKCKLVAYGLGQENAAFASVSRAPFNTDDIDLPLGFSIRNLLISKGFSHALLVDMHNSKADDPDMTSGSRSYFELEDTVTSLVEEGEGLLRVGIAHDDLSGFTAANGIGKAGMNVAVLEAGKKRGCIILIDANNALPAFRSHIQESLVSFNFDFVDIYTTDSHAVNTISGVHNPLGLNVQSHVLLPIIHKAVSTAIRDLEPATAKVANARIKIHVLGENRTSELVSTINAVVAVLRIIAPIVLAGSVILAFIALIFMGNLIV